MNSDKFSRVNKDIKYAVIYSFLYFFRTKKLEYNVKKNSSIVNSMNKGINLKNNLDKKEAEFNEIYKNMQDFISKYISNSTKSNLNKSNLNIDPFIKEIEEIKNYIINRQADYILFLESFQKNPHNRFRNPY